MTRNKVSQDEDGYPVIDPTTQLALLWSYNPKGDYGEENQMVGSVHAHKGHLERHGGVYWGLLFEVGKKILSDFSYPMSGYLYNSSSQVVEYRARIIAMTSGYPEEWLEYVPVWRSKHSSNKRVFILMDQLDEIFPARAIDEFHFYETRKQVSTPPHGNYLKILDPLY